MTIPCIIGAYILGLCHGLVTGIFIAAIIKHFIDLWHEYPDGTKEEDIGLTSAWWDKRRRERIEKIKKK